MSAIHSTNQEAFDCYLPDTSSVIKVVAHPKDPNRCGILFVTDTNLHQIRSDYLMKFSECLVEINVDPVLCISIVEEEEKVGLLTVGNPELPEISQMVGVFASEKQWERALARERENVGLLLISAELLPDTHFQ